MSTTWLYGIEVHSARPLFRTHTDGGAAAPGDHPAVQLLERDALRGDQLADQVGLTEQTRFQLTHGRQLGLYSDRPLAQSLPGQPWRLDVERVVSFHWCGGEHSMFYELREAGNWELMAFWFTHIVLPLQLTLERGYDFLHAAAVDLGGAPALFIAPSGGGKSTLAAFFLQQGHALWSDDKLATFHHEDDYWAAPSHPHHRPWREFEVLGRPVVNFAPQSRPIRAIYCLRAEDPAADITIEELVGFRKFEELLPQYLFNFDHLLEHRLAWLGQMLDAVPVYCVHRPWALPRLRETYLAVCAHATAR